MHRRVIDGRFELVERLGGGGMGLVWRAWDVALHREVALKEVRPPDPVMDEHNPAGARELRARVLREARALARLNHPHVAVIHHIVDPGEHDYPWIVMELVPGGSLQDRIQHGPMPPDAVTRLGREVLSALRAAHAVGIQHRDVKPANVLLREDGRSVLTDFGIAAVRESTTLTATGAFIGSPEYMAPERINGVEGEPASDLWSLGMMMYVAVEGRHPLRRSTALATLAAVLNQEVPPPERAGPLAPVLAALLVRDLEARPDAATLDRMLESAGGAPPGSYPPAFSDTPGPGAPSGPPAPHAPMSSGPQLSGSHSSGSWAARPMAGGAGTAPPGHGGAPHPPPQGGTPVAKAGARPRKGARTVAITASTAVVVAAGVLVWQWFPSLGTAGPGASRSLGNAPVTEPSDREPSGGDSSGRRPTASGSPSAGTQAAKENLLTTAGVRAMIAKVKPVIGGTKVVKMVVYPEYASVDVPVKGDPEIYRSFSYRDGEVSQSPMGGKVRGPTVDLSTYNWDALPALVRKATKDLGVPKPTSRYVIVDPDYGFDGIRQALLVYASDGIRSGYLVANRKGKVLRMFPDD
ncbi:protein kinase domain-containing protein [Nonomuraea sp. KM88]|uniref:protein kinase domain-containing protein n=1 Tax=Nonomuraea sp. KM88 TaxID=3457427 RepID=UPI003FCDAD1E